MLHNVTAENCARGDEGRADYALFVTLGNGSSELMFSAVFFYHIMPLLLLQIVDKI